MRSKFETAFFVLLQPAILVAFGLLVKDGWIVTEMMGIAYLLIGLALIAIWMLDKIGFLPSKED